MAQVRIPTPLRRLTKGEAEVSVDEVRRFVNIYVNDEDVRFLDGTETKTGPDDIMSIIPAIAGG
jgi:molybdopterin converting factor small subunit